MFYSHFVLTKKGPLGKVWIAATLGESKIPKSFATTAKIHVICENIERPAAPFALRLSASLMLGVVRVFSRKSTIMLSDITTIVQALSRYTPSQNPQRGRKRQADALSTEPNMHMPISLDAQEAEAQYDEITIPASKRRRRRAGDADITLTPRGHLDDNASLLNSWPPLARGMEDNVLAMMETLFPSVPTANRRRKPTSLENSENRRYRGYEAREEDITLPVMGSALDPVATDLFDDDEAMGASRRQGDRSSSDRLSIVRSLFNRSDDANGSGSSVKVAPQPIPEDTAIDRDEIGPIEPMDLIPLQLTDIPRARVPTPVVSQQEVQPVPQPEEDEIAVEGEGKEREKESRSTGTRSVIAGEPVGTTAEARATLEEGREGIEEVPRQIDTGRKGETTQGRSSGTKSNATRSRRLNAVAMDAMTEFSAREFRSHLNDTSDLVLASDEIRTSVRRGRGRKRQGPAIGGMPSFIGRFAKELGDMWQEITTVGMQEVEGANNNGIAEGNVAEVEQIRAVEDASLHRVPTLGEDEDNIGPLQREGGQQVVPSLDDAGIERIEPPIFDAGALSGSVGKGSSSVEQMRATRRDKDGASAVGDRTMSLSGHSKGTETMRDSLFDMITPADFKSYEKAKEISQTRTAGKTDEHPRRAMVSSDRMPLAQDLQSAFEDTNRTPREQSLFNVNTSDLQLIEQTENDEQEGVQYNSAKGPVGAIGIRAFKLLEILRTKGKQGTTMSVAGSDHATVSPPPIADATIILFDDLMSGCSRRIRAHGFYNMLNLINSQFIKATQNTPYGPISLTAGTYF